MATLMKRSWMDRAVGAIAPRWQMQRVRARVATELVLRHYEGASIGRRTQGWTRTSTDANAATAPFTGRLRDVARDLVRNNGYAEAALATIADHTVGTGIIARPQPTNVRALSAWKDWAETTACDADGQTDFYGLQKLVLRTVAEAGEVLVRRRVRLPDDGFPLPVQLQVLEPDFLDTTKHGITTPNGGRIVYGVEFNPIGQRVAYWLYPEHPGNSAFPTGTSVRVPADGVLHVFRSTRPSIVRGASWFGPVLLHFKDLDEYEDATLMKQKIAACLAVITSDVDGTSAPIGTADDLASPAIDSLEPGAIMNVTPGRSVEVVQPPSVADYEPYTRAVLRKIATGLGVTYEDLTGDFSQVNFSSSRMARLKHYARVDDWRWRLLIPQFCDRSWQWAMQAAQIMNLVSDIPRARWTAPPIPMIEPDKEGLAIMRRLRIGIVSWSDAVREQGYDPDELLAEIAADNDKIDALGLKFDGDPRYLTQAGQMQNTGAAAPADPNADGGNAPANG